MPTFSQTDRVFRLSTQLSLCADGITVAELAKRLQVDIRTIRRDLAALIRLGLSIEKTRPHATVPYRYRLRPSTSLPELHLTWDEAVALWLAVQRAGPATDAPMGQALRTAFDKIRIGLGAVAQDQLALFEDRLHAAPPRSAPTVGEQLFEDLLFAVEECRTVHLTYTSLDSTEPTIREVQPYSIHRSASGHWYLSAFDPNRGAVRHYKYDRIAAVDVTDVRFVKPADFDVRKQFADALGVHAPAGPPEDVLIHFTGTAAKYAAEVRIHASQQLRPAPDGSVFMELKLSPTPELHSWIRSFGAAAEVVSPPGLREEIAMQFHEASSIYEPSSKRTSRTMRWRKP